MQGGEEIEGVMEKAWDLHDKMSDAISTLSKSHFLLNSIHHQTTTGSENLGSFIHIPNTQRSADAMQEGGGGEENRVAETISLNTIRSTLEALEDQLHILHIQQSQQRAERDATLTQLEESRLILLRRLTEHHGRQWDFIKQALAFATYRGEEEDIHVSPSSFLYPTVGQLDGAIYSEKKMIFDEKIGDYQNNSFNGLTHFLSISIQFVTNSDRLHKIAGVVAKAAFVAVGILGILGMQQIGQRRTKRDPFHEKSRAHVNNNKFKKKQKFRSTEDKSQKHTTSERMELPAHLQSKNLNVIFGRG